MTEKEYLESPNGKYRFTLVCMHDTHSSAFKHAQQGEDGNAQVTEKDSGKVLFETKTHPQYVCACVCDVRVLSDCLYAAGIVPENQQQNLV